MTIWRSSSRETISRAETGSARASSLRNSGHRGRVFSSPGRIRTRRRATKRSKGKKRTTMIRLKRRCPKAICWATPGDRLRSNARNGGRAAMQIAAPTALKKKWEKAARLPPTPETIPAKRAVTVVPTLAPMTMGRALSRLTRSCWARMARMPMGIAEAWIRPVNSAERVNPSRGCLASRKKPTISGCCCRGAVAVPTTLRPKNRRPK